MTDFSELNLGIDGDSITAGEQWSFHVYKNLGMKSHSNVAVGSSVGTSAHSKLRERLLPRRTTARLTSQE